MKKDVNSLYKVNFSEAKDYVDPYGIWKVTTEGDCEGKSSKQLGIYQGHIKWIALYLADYCYYSLRFEKVNIPKIDMKDSLTSDANEVNISFGWGFPAELDSNEDIAIFCDNHYNNAKQEANTFYTILPSNYYKSVTLRREWTDKEAQVRLKALSKLTDEEKEALGIKTDYYTSRREIPY